MSDRTRDVLLFAILLAVVASAPAIPDGMALFVGIVAVLLGTVAFLATVTPAGFGRVVPEEE
ncbi:hypothetical protein DM867_12705 [Halosegnis rubeus]|jgi:hypothetical protein|uniref:Uncharacterized protein n=1 Tax=Halosegnis rubeus TaxID=2212850 RepID=A0A5N5U1N2_9EURY|nr:hypothetical protein [Halosegnis rubeus]KAB7512446.1 hypothetical protein DM867_12705 [Halosegnis rubeus]KAB7512706.1 hypothetical protein DMP03_13720 [Halosegnis rubeus]KAB7514125.1 hypothetical protein DP108_12520 [Halosegnis rubeus]